MPSHTDRRDSVDSCCLYDQLSIHVSLQVECRHIQTGETPLIRAICMYIYLSLQVECRHIQTGETPLIRAAAGGHLKVVQHLVQEFHADVNAADGEVSDTVLYLIRYCP